MHTHGMSNTPLYCIWPHVKEASKGVQILLDSHSARGVDAMFKQTPRAECHLGAPHQLHRDMRYVGQVKCKIASKDQRRTWDTKRKTIREATHPSKGKLSVMKINYPVDYLGSG